MRTTAAASADLAHEFNNADVANVGDATGLRGSSAPGSYYLSLHSTWQGLTGNQASNELSYSGYARQAVSRNGSAGFTVSSNAATLTANVEFPACPAGTTGKAYFFGVGTASSGAGVLRHMGGIGGTPVECTALASNDTVSAPELSGSLAVDDPVVFWGQGGSLPTGITEGTVYFVKTVSGGDFTVSTTAGGSTLNITADGACLVQRLTPINLSENAIPRLTTSTTITAT